MRYAASPSLGTPSTRSSPWSALHGFRLNAAPSARIVMRCMGESIAVEGAHLHDAWPAHVGDAMIVFENGDAYEFTLDTGEAPGGELAASDGAILSPMPGKIVSVAAKAGATLKKGDPILVLEAMKMEHTLTAPFDGKVAELKARVGEQVGEGAALARIEAV
jgi:3-methylcrotonyl-CoA carboxylase alpha subunit